MHEQTKNRSHGVVDTKKEPQLQKKKKRFVHFLFWDFMQSITCVLQTLRHLKI